MKDLKSIFCFTIFCANINKNYKKDYDNILPSYGFIKRL